MQLIVRLKKILFSRVIIVSSLIMVQLLILLLFVLRLSQYFAVMYAIFLMISLLALLYIANKNLNTSYKLAWIIPILLFPLFGGLFYMLLGTGRLSRSMKEMISQIEGAIRRVCPQDPESFSRLDAKSPDGYAQAQYLAYSGHTLFEHTETIYHQIGRAHV